MSAICVLLACLVLFGSAEHAAGRGYMTTHVTGDVVNVRARPDTAQPIVAKLEWGDFVLLLPLPSDSAGLEGWLHIRVPKTGPDGWILKSLTSERIQKDEGKGRHSGYEYRFHRERNVYFVEWDPSIPVAVVGGMGAMAALVDSIFGPGEVLEPYPRAIPGAGHTLFRVVGKSDYYYVLPIRDTVGGATAYHVWKGRLTAAG